MFGRKHQLNSQNQTEHSAHMMLGTYIRLSRSPTVAAPLVDEAPPASLAPEEAITYFCSAGSSTEAESSSMAEPEDGEEEARSASCAHDQGAASAQT